MKEECVMMSWQERGYCVIVNGARELYIFFSVRCVLGGVPQHENIYKSSVNCAHL